jgi:hypothetical protein
MNLSSKSAICSALCLSAVFGCSAAPSTPVPWAEQRTVVIHASRMAVEVPPVSGDACLTYEGACLKPHERCGKQGADVILDAEGHLLDYLCYPGEANLSVEDIEAHRGDIAQNQNDAVILLDALDDGVDIDGDLSIDANNVVLYADDPRTALVSGSVELAGNNIVMRGVGVQGDLTVRNNNVTVALAVVGGDLIVQGNNVQVLATDVLGSVTITGSNAKLLGNHVAGTLSVIGRGFTCRDNTHAEDADEDGSLDQTELTEPLTCG